MTDMTYAQRLQLLHALCITDTQTEGAKPSTDLNDYDVLQSAHYLASFVTFKAIQAAERQPGQELQENFDMLSVYQAYALLVFAFLTQPLVQEGKAPDFQASQVIIAKTLFAGLPDEPLAEILVAGLSKFQLIGDATVEHWETFRENLDKVTVSFVIAGTDDESPHQKEDILPLFGQLLSQLCEAFEQV